jgi:hypothetical protein
MNAPIALDSQAEASVRGHVSVLSDLVIAWILFVLATAIFILSPTRQFFDSKYTVLLSEALLKHHSFELDRYFPAESAAEDYRLEKIRGHVFSYFPPGSSILSLPMVAAANALGFSAVNAAGKWNDSGEFSIESVIASLLMAGLTAMVFLMSRTLLPRGLNLVVTAGTALGTQVWSCASRALWSDTWGIFLLTVAVWMLVRIELQSARFRPALLATILAWMYIVRPTYAIHIVAISIYVLVTQRRFFLRFAIVGLAWLAALIAYSEVEFHTLLPAYFFAGRITFESFWWPLAGLLFSPSRGLLIYVPVVLFIGYLIARFWKILPLRRLVYVALAVIAANFVQYGGYSVWHGGHCYGARFMTNLVPWFALLGIIGLRAMLDDRGLQSTPMLQTFWKEPALLSGAALLVLSIAINARGALVARTNLWNLVPINVDDDINRCWDWRQPQFLFGLVPVPPPPMPKKFPALRDGVPITFYSDSANPYLLSGWSGNEGWGRWSDGHRAVAIFQIPREAMASAHRLRINLSAMIVKNKCPEQKVTISLNDHDLQTLRLTDEAFFTVTVGAPAEFVREKNALTFKLPNAISPLQMRTSADPRELGIRVAWIAFDPAE